MNSTPENSHERTIDMVHRLLCEHGWGDHYRCGWYDGPEGEGTVPNGDVCSKDRAERESVELIVHALASAGLLA